MSTTYVALSGGIGGAKLSLGLAHLLGERLSVVVNTGDDFVHLGLHISPDVDTTLYTLSGVVNETTGWGRRDETWTFMRALGELGGPKWFNLGDGDLATHIDRTQRLAAGETLSDVTAHLARALGVTAHILPMTDEPLRTIVETDTGTLGFQEYFVREQCRPAVRRIRFDDDADTARPAAPVLRALAEPGLGGIIICPSNPWLSVDPILAVPGLRAALRAARVPIIAVSPIIAGKAVKGPTAKIMTELGITPDSSSIANHYAPLLDGIVIDTADAHLADKIAVPSLATNTLMRTLDDRVALAEQCLAFCSRIAVARSSSADRIAISTTGT